MDDFVKDKLNEWGLSEWINTFQEQEIDKEALCCLDDDEEIKNLIPRTGPRLKFKKRLKLFQSQQGQKEADDSPFIHPGPSSNQGSCTPQVKPSTSGTAKRKLDPLGESSKWSSSTKQQRRTTPGSRSETIVLPEVKSIMRCVYNKLVIQDKPTKLNDFLKTKIEELKINQRELVGVFGRTGAGKSSLINAVLGEEDLLPSGTISACTSVMIKVEANVDKMYEAEIEFISKEEWENELWSMSQFLGDDADQKQDADDGHDDECSDIEEKLSALYGEEWKQKIQFYKELMHNRYFKEIPEFLSSKTKTLTCETAKELSSKFVKYTRSDSQQGQGGKEQGWYWPLVKCVTVKVPNTDLLQHVTLVDLPGSGDRNKSRDEMWKGIVKNCSAVWIVTEINRAASEKEPWEILESVTSLIGNGGQCQHIHFICTKSDCINKKDNQNISAQIMETNKLAKDTVNREFTKQKHIRKHFSDDTFEVFTVSSTEFFQRKLLKPEDTEIPKLQECLQNLSDCHSETLNYVSGAHGILSLIKGASCRHGVNTDTVCEELEKNLNEQLCEVRKVMKETYETLEKCLDAGVENSKTSHEKKLKSFLYPKKSGSAFHKTLKGIVEKRGVHKPKKGAPINLNMKLSSHLTDSIDEEFRRTFPLKTEGQFRGVINSFSLHTENLIEKYKDVELQLIFLKSEEDMMKTKMNEMIQGFKKIIYMSLTETIETFMQGGYDRAVTFSGSDSLKNMRETLEKHVHDSKYTMFDQAKNTMLDKLRVLQVFIEKTLEKTMMESIRLSMQTDNSSIPDVSKEFEEVKKFYNELRNSPEEEKPLSE